MKLPCAVLAIYEQRDQVRLETDSCSIGSFICTQRAEQRCLIGCPANHLYFVISFNDAVTRLASRRRRGFTLHVPRFTRLAALRTPGFSVCLIVHPFHPKNLSLTFSTYHHIHLDSAQGIEERFKRCV